MPLDDDLFKTKHVTQRKGVYQLASKESFASQEKVKGRDRHIFFLLTLFHGVMFVWC